MAALQTEVQDLKKELSLTKLKVNHCNERIEEKTVQLAEERALRNSLQGKLTQTATVTPNPSLIIGSSIVRDFDESLYTDTQVISQSGAKPTDITKTLKEKAENRQKYQKVTLVTGGNQLSDEGDNIPAVIDNMKDTIKAAKEVASRVTVCELPPRIHSTQATTTMMNLNVALRQLAEESDCDFAETGAVFYLANGQPNDGYYEQDGIHLNLNGSAKLVECLDVPLKPPGKVKVRPKAAYKQSRVAYAEVAKKNPKKTPSGPTKPKSSPPNSAQQKPTPPQAKRNLARPTIAEDGFCGYCGEPGHRYQGCWHGQPVVCGICKAATHKSKFCRHYAK